MPAAEDESPDRPARVAPALFTENAEAGPSRPRRAAAVAAAAGLNPKTWWARPRSPTPSPPPLPPPKPKRRKLTHGKHGAYSTEGIRERARDVQGYAWYRGDLTRHITETDAHFFGADDVRLGGRSDGRMTGFAASFVFPSLARWSGSEKGRFFAALARHSRLRPDLIAADVGSKSELDVVEYLHLLELAAASLTDRKGLFTEAPQWWSRLLGSGACEVAQGWVAEEDGLAEAVRSVEATRDPPFERTKRLRRRRGERHPKRREVEKWGRRISTAQLDTLADALYVCETRLAASGSAARADSNENEVDPIEADNETIALIQDIPKRERTAEERARLQALLNRRRMRQTYRRKRLLASGLTDVDIDRGGGPDAVFTTSVPGGAKRKGRGSRLAETHPEVAHLVDLGVPSYLTDRGWEIFNYGRIADLVTLYKQAYELYPADQANVSFGLIATLTAALHSYVYRLLNDVNLIAAQKGRGAPPEVTEEDVDAALQLRGSRDPFLYLTDAVKGWQHLGEDIDDGKRPPRLDAGLSDPEGGNKNAVESEQEAEDHQADAPQIDPELLDFEDEGESRRLTRSRRTSNVPSSAAGAETSSDAEEEPEEPPDDVKTAAVPRKKHERFGRWSRHDSPLPTWTMYTPPIASDDHSPANGLMIQPSITDDEDEQLDAALAKADAALDAVVERQLAGAVAENNRTVDVDPLVWMEFRGMRGRNWAKKRANPPVAVHLQTKLERAQKGYARLMDSVLASRRNRRLMRERTARFPTWKETRAAAHLRRTGPLIEEDELDSDIESEEEEEWHASGGPSRAVSPDEELVEIGASDDPGEYGGDESDAGDVGDVGEAETDAEPEPRYSVWEQPRVPMPLHDMKEPMFWPYPGLADVLGGDDALDSDDRGQVPSQGQGIDPVFVFGERRKRPLDDAHSDSASRTPGRDDEQTANDNGEVPAFLAGDDALDSEDDADGVTAPTIAPLKASSFRATSEAAGHSHNDTDADGDHVLNHARCTSPAQLPSPRGEAGDAGRVAADLGGDDHDNVEQETSPEHISINADRGDDADDDESVSDTETEDEQDSLESVDEQDVASESDHASHVNVARYTTPSRNPTPLHVNSTPLGLLGGDDAIDSDSD